MMMVCRNLSVGLVDIMLRYKRKYDCGQSEKDAIYGAAACSVHESPYFIAIIKFCQYMSMYTKSLFFFLPMCFHMALLTDPKK